MASAAASMTEVKTRRPPYWSVQTPSGERTSEPVRIGVPTSRPNCVSLRPRSFLIWMPMMAKIVHTAKQMVKAMVESHNARCAFARVAFRRRHLRSVRQKAARGGSREGYAKRFSDFAVRNALRWTSVGRWWPTISAATVVPISDRQKWQ